MQRRHHYTLAVVLFFSVAGSFLVYGNSIKGGFVYDDVVVVQKRPDLRNIGHLPKLFIEPYHIFTPQSSLFRPATMASYALNYAILGKSPAGFHIVNIILHAFTTALVFWLVLDLFGRRDLAWISWLLFLVHPIHTEAVTSIVGRAEILALLFALLFLYFSTRNRWLCGLLLLFALWSKESAAMAVPILGLIQIVKYRAPIAAIWRRFAYLFVPISIYVLTRYLALKQYFIHETNTAFVENPLAFAPWHERLFTALKILVLYLGKLTVPVRLSADYSYDTIKLVSNPFRSWMTIAGALMLILMIWAIVRLFRTPSHAIAGYSAAFFLGFWFLASNLIFPVGTIMGERLMYAPSLGFVLLAGWGFAELAKIKYARFVSISMLAVLSLLYAGRAIARNADWRDNKTLYTVTLRTTPRSATMHTGLAGIAMNTGQWDTARQEISVAGQIYSDYSSLYYLQGALAEHDGDLQTAEGYYRKAVAGNPQGAAVIKLADLLGNQGKFAEAEPLLETILRLSPSDEYIIRYGYTEIVLGKFEVALETLRRYYGTVLTTADQHAVAGTAYFQLGKYLEALDHLNEAKRLGKSTREMNEMITLASKRL